MATKVSVGIPLYRSYLFLPILEQTLRGFDDPDLEILVSDRHHEDEAIDRLREIFQSDGRFRFLTAEDKLDWVAHYNLLLQEARGEYFVWASHDDSYSTGYLTVLARCLDRNPSAVIAHGRVERVTLDGKLLPQLRILRAGRALPTAIRAYRTALNGPHAFHGMFRRSTLIARRLWIRPTVHNIAADALWVFAVALTGEVEAIESCTYIKRYYPSSTHQSWHSVFRLGHILNFASVADSYLDDYAATRGRNQFGKILVRAACSLWFVRILLGRLR